MKVVEVIPIIKGVAKPTLSYFTKDKFAPGSFVRVPVQKRQALALVASSDDVRHAKSELKSAGFALRKLQAVPSAGLLNPAFVKAAKKTADFYAAPLGGVLRTLLPKLVLESPDVLGKPITKSGSPREVKLIQLGVEERYREYRSIVRESLARETSVMLIVPTQVEARKAEQALAIGIEKYVFSPIGKTPKNIKKVLKDALAEKHAILFITTPAYICFDRSDLDTFILDRENSRAYRSLSRPFVDAKRFLEIYASERGANLILGDSTLSLGSLKKLADGIFAEFTPLTWRLKERSETELVDLRAKKEFEVISDRLKKNIESALAERKSVFLFGARKGLASSTVCSDCGSLVLCKNCGAPLVLHDGPIYACHHCGAKRSAETRCDYCESWKLTPLGVGIDRIHSSIKELFPEAKIFLADKDKASTPARVRALVREFQEMPGSILIGTELPLAYLEDIPLVAAVSLDSLFSIPDFFINERIFYLIVRLREIASERFILQTRNAGAQILEFAGAGNILDFYRTELSEREELRYPPFSIFVKASIEGDPETLQKKAAFLLSLFARFDPQFLMESRGAKHGELSMVMRFDRERWPVSEARDKLLLLPQEFLIKVDPESLF